MKIYLVHNLYSGVCGVFSTKEKALEAISNSGICELKAYILDSEDEELTEHFGTYKMGEKLTKEVS